jgi:DNA-binding NtrC family response regulator
MIAYTSIPALIALAFKFILFAYAIKSPMKGQDTRLYFTLLVFLALHNISEVAILNYFPRYGLDSTLEIFGFIYFATFIPFIAILLHLSLRLSIDSLKQNRRYFILIYAPAILLEGLLIFTDELVRGFVPFTFSIIRDPGPLYFLLETYVNLYLLAAFVNLLYGARKSRTPTIAKIRNRLWLLALAPMVLLMSYLIVSHHFGWTKLASTFYVPIAATFFLIVTTYATYQYRLFDIQFFIPWSKIRKRKTAFYDRIRAMIAEIADLGSVDKVVNRLAETLRCSVALVGASKPVLALAGGSKFMSEIPRPMLQKIDQIVIADEIVDSMPEVHQAMQRNCVAAIVPFHPRSQYARGWLLLGESFSEQVYTPRDFRMVEELFDKMADLFLDKLLSMRTQLAESARQVRLLEERQEVMHTNLVLLKNENEQLYRQNARLLKEQPADSLILNPGVVSSKTLAPTVTLLGRDKALLKTLRNSFPQATQFVGADSSGFKYRAMPDVLLCRLEEGEERTQAKLLKLITDISHNTAKLLYGPGAHSFVSRYKKSLLGNLLEAVPENSNEEVLARKICGLAELRKSVYAISDPDQPLIGQSRVFVEQMSAARRLAYLADPVLIKTEDGEQAIALGAYIHDLSGNKGKFHLLRTTVLTNGELTQALLGEKESGIARLLADTCGGTLMIDDIGKLPTELRTTLLTAIYKQRDVRLLAACPLSVDQSGQALLAPFRPFTLEMPPMRERKTDIPLLTHYFTLQFNLQTGGCHYLKQSEHDDMMASHYPQDVAALKHSVFEILKCRGIPAAGSQVGSEADLTHPLTDKTLDQHVAEFEAYIISETIKRCGGNKSKAARLLGMRPNTLHYKLERYGLLSEKKPALA